MQAAETVVVIPTYNEVESLPKTLELLFRSNSSVHVLIVDDASPDGTGEVAQALAESDPRIQVLHRKRKQGLGPAYLEGFRLALDHGYRAIVEMDADGSHQASDLAAILALLEQHGLAIGSRWVPGGQTQHWPLWRRALSRGGNAYVRALLRLPVRDSTSGFRAYRAETLRSILDQEGISSSGYCFQIDMTRRAQRVGAEIAEAPICFREREFGVSKMRGRIVLEAIARVPLWGWEELLQRRRARR